MVTYIQYNRWTFGFVHSMHYLGCNASERFFPISLVAGWPLFLMLRRRIGLVSGKHVGWTVQCSRWAPTSVKVSSIDCSCSYVIITIVSIMHLSSTLVYFLQNTWFSFLHIEKWGKMNIVRFLSHLQCILCIGEQMRSFLALVIRMKKEKFVVKSIMLNGR
mgnify:CR=1 FL=1